MDLNKLKCTKCGTTKSHSKKFDSYYCESCNEWLEDICTDRDCVFCKQRPFKPNEVNTQTGE